MQGLKRTQYRILYMVARGDAFGGSSLHVMEMARHLKREGHVVRILIGGTEDMEVPRRFAKYGIDFVCLPSLGRDIRPWRDLKAVFSIRKEIRRFRPDLVSLHASKAGALGRVAALGMNLPVLYTPHCWSFVEDFPKARFYRWVEKILAPAATRIVTVSEDERRFGLSHGVGRPDKTITIHNGVRDRFHGKMDRKERGPQEELRLVMVGRFEKQKDQQLLLRALGSLRDYRWRMTFIGDGPLLGDSIELAEKMGLSDRIEFAGYCEKVDQVLIENDLFLLITCWEGFPRSILEAMAASLPVVATDVGGSRESVRNGVTGCLVSKGDVDSLIEALRGLFEDPVAMQKMGQRGREHFRKYFTIDRMVANYRKLYRELIGFGPEADVEIVPHEKSAEPMQVTLPVPRPASHARTSH